MSCLALDLVFPNLSCQASLWKADKFMTIQFCIFLIGLFHANVRKINSKLRQKILIILIFILDWTDVFISPLIGIIV